MQRTPLLALRLALIIALVGCTTFTASSVSAKTVTWSGSAGIDLIRNQIMAGVSPNAVTDGYVTEVRNPKFTVSYGADVFDAVTGEQIPDGASIPVGSRLRFVPKSFERSDVSWTDTIYTVQGRWTQGAASPPVSCNASDYYSPTFSTVVGGGDGPGGPSSYPTGKAYIPLPVNTPSISIVHSGTALLTCTNNGIDCTVNSGGTIESKVTFGATYGRLYYQHSNEDPFMDYFGGGTINNQPYACTGNTNPLRSSSTGLYHSPSDYSPPYCFVFKSHLPDASVSPARCSLYDIGPAFTQTIPQQSITFLLTATDSNRPPNPPIITGPTTGGIATAHTFSVRATDPDNDTLRYGIDWNLDGTVDEWAPASGFVPSGTTEDTNHSWPTEGGKIFQALAQDAKGANSGWTRHTITLDYPQLSGACQAVPGTAATGQSVMWTVSPAGGTGAYSYSWSGTDGLTGTAQSVAKTYSTEGSKQASVTIRSGSATVTTSCGAVIENEPQPDQLSGSCSVNPNAIATGASATWTVTASGGTGAYTYSWSGTDGLTGSGASVTKSYATSGTKTASVTITSGPGATTVDCATLTVGTPSEPDLVAGNVTAPSTAAVGETLMLAARATNVGTLTSGSFPMLFQIQSPEVLKNSGYLSALAPQASESAAINHAFATAGTYQVRACANFNTAWVAITPESRYDNNCGEWTTITVGTPPNEPPTTPTDPSYSCNADGTQATLRWSPSSNASYYWVRVWNTGSCPAGWEHPTSNGNVCVPKPDQVYGTSITYPTTPNQRLSWSVGATNGQPYPAGASGNADGSFVCTAEQPTGGLSCNVDNEQPTVGSTVTYTAFPTGETRAPYIWNDQQGNVDSTNGRTFSRLITDAAPKIMIVNGDNAANPASCPVVTASCVNPKAEITASPLRVRAGEDDVTVRWNASGINDRCEITGTNGFIRVNQANACTISGDSVTMKLETQTTFRIKCDNGRAEDQVVVNVIPKFVEF